MDELIANTWKAEINAASGKADLLDAIRRLPPTAFLRMCLALHFMTRVYWNHWELQNRMVLLDAAILSLEPLGGRKIDKAKIARLIQREGAGAVTKKLPPTKK